MAPHVVIVGAGAAGVYSAYRLRRELGRSCEITLLERNDRVGGNAMAMQVDDARVECGAQFFHRGAQSQFMALVDELELWDACEVVRTAAGFTIWDRAARRRLLHLPATIGGFRSLGLGDWGRAAKFGVFLAYAYALERWESDWTLTVDAWFDRMRLLDDDFKRRVLAPFLYQFVSLPPARIGEASAKYAVTYLVRTLFPGRGVRPAVPRLGGVRPTFEAYQSLVGIDEIHRRVLVAADVTPRLGAAVRSIRPGQAGVEIEVDGATLRADHVVLATDPHVSAELLARGGASSDGLVEGLRALEYARLPISIQHGRPGHMPERRADWQPFNTIVDGDSMTFSIWFGPMRRPAADGSLRPVFKSWGSPGLPQAPDADELLAHHHVVPLPTATFMATRERVIDRWQGEGRVWLAGGWTRWFDSQEAALASADAVVAGITRSRTATTQAPIVARDDVAQLLDRTAALAPVDVRDRLASALARVEADA